jgi:hypothetical protein
LPSKRVKNAPSVASVATVTGFTREKTQITSNIPNNNKDKSIYIFRDDSDSCDTTKPNTAGKAQAKQKTVLSEQNPVTVATVATVEAKNTVFSAEPPVTVATVATVGPDKASQATQLEAQGLTMLRLLATEMNHPLPDLLSWYQHDLADLGEMPIAQARAVVADYLTNREGYRPDQPDPAAAIREAVEERRSIQIEDGGLTELEAQQQAELFERYLQHIMGEGKTTGCCWPPTGRYCETGRQLWQARTLH